MNFERVAMQALPEVCALFQAAVQDMQARGLMQWTWGKYPREDILRADIEQDQLWRVDTDEGLAAAFAVVRGQGEEYADVPWRYGVNPACLHRVALMPDTTLDLALGMGDFGMIVLPGGMGGTNALAADARVAKLLQKMAADGKHVCAVCAAPLVLAKAGLLQGKTFTAYPGVVDGAVSGGTNTGAAIEADGKIITSRGPGTAMDFALHLVEVLAGRDTRDKVEKALVR